MNRLRLLPMDLEQPRDLFLGPEKKAHYSAVLPK